MTWDDLRQTSLDKIVTWAQDQPWCRAMADCQQDVGWHAEGDVWTHTKMVCAQLPKLAEWPVLKPHEQTVLIFTALFHDSAKPLTSQVDPATGRVTSPKHAIKGEHLARSVLRDVGCGLAVRKPYRFGNDQARFQFFRQKEPNLHYVPHEDYRCTVTMMSGLPASGKDTWLATHRGDLPVISLDDMRDELGVEATDNQGQVAQLARERCREMLRARTAFAFNATNLLRQTRQRWIDLFADYNARIEMAYVEPALSVILDQNKRRNRSVPEDVIVELANKLEPPTWTETHGLIVSDGEKSWKP